MEDIMKYRDRYQSIQVNVDKKKYKDLLEWLYKTVEEDDRSINSFIIKLLKKEFNNAKKIND